MRRLTPLEAERLQGFPDGWTVPEGKTVQEIADLDSPRYAALGNAVSVPVAAWLGSRIIHMRKEGSASVFDSLSVASGATVGV